VKTEFGKFGDILDKTRKKLDEISNTMSKAGARSRAIQRKLKDVEALPVGEDVELLDEDVGAYGVRPDETDETEDEEM